jgi:hypothetical protein
MPNHDKQNDTRPTKMGWRVNEWADDVGISRSFAYELLTAGTIASVKAGAARIITTRPAEYLASLKS